MAKISSDQAKPNGILWMHAGQEPVPGAARDAQGPGRRQGDRENLHDCGIRKVGDLAALEERTLEQRFGKWGLALAGKSRGFDAGGWFGAKWARRADPKSISHEHTLMRNGGPGNWNRRWRDCEKVGRGCGNAGLHARTVQLKLRYSDFTTITRAHTLDHPTQLDTELFEQVRTLFRRNWTAGSTIRLLGVQTSGFEQLEGQLDLLESDREARWRKALSAVDRLRDKFGDESVSLAAGLKGRFRERIHEAMPNSPAKKPASSKAAADSHEDPEE